MAAMSYRAGRYKIQAGGFRAFLPKPLPPDPPLRVSLSTLKLLNDAGLALGRLDGLTVNLPNPKMFLSMYVRKEALLSSQIEGTQASLDDVLAFEADPETKSRRGDAVDVVNYTTAMEHGIDKLETLPICLRLIRDIHRILLKGTRGDSKTPGEFRDSQNWIGPTDCTLQEATFVPPPPDMMHNALKQLEKFINTDENFPSLILCALVHAQFETIHPFLDGNGRVGRLLITFMLCERKVLRQPLLYLSYFFKANRQEYYDRLNAVRFEGAWEQWVEFFLRGAIEVSEQATKTAEDILEMRSSHERLVRESRPRGAANALALLEMLSEHPYVTARWVGHHISVSQPTAISLLSLFCDLGLVREVTGQKWGQLFSYEPYLSLLRQGTMPESGDAQKATTG